MSMQSRRSTSTAMTGEGGRYARQPSDRPSSAAASFAKPDIVRRFLAWAQSADAEARAEGASALARAYLYSDLPEPMRAEAELAMTALLDDPSVLVRRALAEALCRAGDAPRAVILALAADEPEVAAAVLQHSPVLTDADLVDCVANGDVVAQIALAQRPDLPRRANAALGRDRTTRRGSRAHRQSRDRSFGANCSRAFLTRFGDDASRARGAARAPVAAGGLKSAHRGGGGEGFSVEASQWMAPARAERVAREARDQAICAIASCVPSGRAGGVHACAARSRRADAGLAAAFAARRGRDSVRRRLWRNCRACRCRASPPSSLSRMAKALPRSPAGLA